MEFNTSDDIKFDIISLCSLDLEFDKSLFNVLLQKKNLQGEIYRRNILKECSIKIIKGWSRS